MIKAGLDIGNSKISCVIADYKNKENIKMIIAKKYLLISLILALILFNDNLFE